MVRLPVDERGDGNRDEAPVVLPGGQVGVAETVWIGVVGVAEVVRVHLDMEGHADVVDRGGVQWGHCGSDLGKILHRGEVSVISRSPA